MRHRVRTIKFRYGKDANRMLERKLLKNFVASGRMTTTEKKIKMVRRQVEELVQLAKKNSEASKILLKKRLSDKKAEDVLIKFVAPVFKERVSGFTTLIHLPQRESDGAVIARLEWSAPVVIEKPKPAPKKIKPQEVKTTVTPKTAKKTLKPVKKTKTK